MVRRGNSEGNESTIDHGALNKGDEFCGDGVFNGDGSGVFNGDGSGVFNGGGKNSSNRELRHDICCVSFGSSWLWVSYDAWRVVSLSSNFVALANFTFGNSVANSFLFNFSKSE
ncbi:hypothetical protein Dimus_011150 [Dionaea muscipula]